MKNSLTTRITTAAVLATLLAFGVTAQAASVPAGNYQTHVVPTQHQYIPEHHSNVQAETPELARIQSGNYQTYVVPAPHRYIPENQADADATESAPSYTESGSDLPDTIPALNSPGSKNMIGNSFLGR